MSTGVAENIELIDTAARAFTHSDKPKARIDIGTSISSTATTTGILISGDGDDVYIYVCMEEGRAERWLEIEEVHRQAHEDSGENYKMRSRHRFVGLILSSIQVALS